MGSARSIRSIEKKGLKTMAKDAGIDLWKLPFEDVRPERLENLSNNPAQVARTKKPKNKMKNPLRLAASRKKPLLPLFFERDIYWVRAGEENKVLGLTEAQSTAEP